jgi:transposase InsO family protein
MNSVVDQGIQRIYIMSGTPRLNGKLEHSQKTECEEFYQLFKHTGDIDLNRRLQDWRRFYNFHRPHSAYKVLAPYRFFKKKIAPPQNVR